MGRRPPVPLHSSASFPEMILEAIVALKDDNISNESAILGYIKGKYGACLPLKHASLVRSHLARMVCAGEVVLNQSNYHQPDPAPVVAADANAVPVKRGRRRRRKRKAPPPEPFTGASVTPSETFVLGAIDAISAKASLGYSLPSLPSYPEMVVEALQALDNENGSNSAAIVGYLEGNYGTRLSGRHAVFVRGQLSIMKARGQVLSVTPTPQAIETA
ncbi:unnamed protein product [Urochloa decumbens]|uniref:H15 domain-containing protein n=1 Tax=Urochloa decumbens TaxID=240449 RepID=A0ABC8VU01_9POAL